MKIEPFFENVKVVLVEENSKKAIDWKTYSTNDDAVKNHQGNLAVNLGESKLIGVDIDDKKLEPLFEKEFSPITFKTETPNGFHYWYKTEETIEGIKTNVAELRSGNNLLMMPNSKINEGEYKPRYFAPFQILTQEKALKIKEWIQTQANNFKQKEGSKSQTNTPLIDIQKRMEIVKLFLPFWEDGERQTLSQAIAGALKHRNMSQDLALDVVEKICNQSKDSEKNQRISAVKSTYAKEPNAHIIGMGKLKEICGEEIEAKFNELVNFKAKIIKLGEQEKKLDFETTKLGERILKGVPEINWLVQDIIPDRGITIFGGASGSQKTFASQELAIAVSTGSDFLEQYTTKQTNVLYCDEENGDKTLISRFNSLMIGRGLKPEELNNINLSIFHNLKLDEQNSSQILLSLIKKTQAKLIIIDSMVRFMVGEEDKSRDVRLIFETLKNVMEKSEEDVSFLLLHHTAKAVRRGLNSLRGSGDFSAFADCVLIFDGRKGYSMVEQVKNRHLDLSQKEPFIIKLVEEKGGLKMIWLAQNEAQGLIEGCADFIKNWYTLADIKIFQTKQVKEIAEKEGYKLNTINNALKSLIENGDLAKQKQGVYKVTGFTYSEEKLQDD